MGADGREEIIDWFIKAEAVNWHLLITVLQADMLSSPPPERDLRLQASG